MNRPRRTSNRNYQQQNNQNYNANLQSNFVPGGNTQQYQNTRSSLVTPPIQTKPEPPSPAVDAVKAFANPEPPPAAPVPVVSNEKDLAVSAVTKALKNMGDGEKKPWKKGVRAPKPVRQRRANSMLARMVAPKSPSALLHQMIPDAEFQTTVIRPDLLQCVIMRGPQQLGVGQGPSKVAAKARASEVAIKKWISGCLNPANAPPKLPPTGDTAMEEDGGEEDSIIDNIPWAGLTSFAIYKLFEEWGTAGPVAPPPTVPANRTKEPKMPENPTAIHPSMLLHQLRPGIKPVDVHSRPTPPNVSFTVAYEVNGQSYSGTATNKKAARKEAAKSVLAAVYGVHYPAEQPAGIAV